MLADAPRDAVGPWLTTSGRKKSLVPGVRKTHYVMSHKKKSSPPLLQSTEVLPEGRTELTQQLHQRVAKDFGSCGFRIEAKGS